MCCFKRPVAIMQLNAALGPQVLLPSSMAVADSDQFRNRMRAGREPPWQSWAGRDGADAGATQHSHHDAYFLSQTK